MELSTVKSGGAHGADKQRFVINLLAQEDGSPYVRSCELQGGGMRQRTSFTKDCGIDEVFDSQVAAGLYECLSRLRAGEKVLALPEFLIELDGLVLAGVHLMVRQEEGGARAIICRFRMLVGLVQRIFHPSLGFDEPLSGVSERLALEMLCDVGLPVLDLCAAADSDVLDGVLEDKAFVRGLTENAHELRFRLELIKRYLKSLDRPKVQAQAMREEHQERLISMRTH